MADSSDPIAMLCGGCCLVLFSGLTAFCGTQRYGAGSGSGSNAGCCNSCCRSNFDADHFDEQVRKDLEKTRDPNAQPAAMAPMSTSANSPGALETTRAATAAPQVSSS